jgi:membrane protease YdiL (CAAX protease family)
MSNWAFWLVLILLALLLIPGALFALREFRKNRKLGSVIVHYILLVVLTTLVLRLLFAVFALSVPFDTRKAQTLRVIIKKAPNLRF